VGIFLEGEDSHGDHGLGRLVEFRLKVPPGTTSSSITTHTSSGQPQKSVTLLPSPGGETTKSTKDMWWHWGEKNKQRIKNISSLSLIVILDEDFEAAVYT